MNFNKLFNKNYFKENLKKSKGMLAFFFGIIPLINILMLVISILSLNDELLLMDFKSISIFTSIGQYFIPFILAVALFGFVFKQKSVDFVMSKPISRKNIYRTNIIGGILVIFLFILINFGIFGITSIICKSVIIPIGLLIDYFVYWFVAYTFIFSISSLAISLSGNIMGSIVIILLVSCMAPFLFLTNAYYDNINNRTYYMLCTEASCKPKNYDCHNNQVCINHLTKNEYKIEMNKEYDFNLTSPFASLLSDVSKYQDTYYTTKSVLKMLILSIVYIIIAKFIFVKRKMENNEISFKNEKLHYIVKSLTMLPVCFVLYLIIRETGGIGLIIGCVASIIYYGIYDLITRKELYHPLKSVMICLTTFGILAGFYTLKGAFYNTHVVTSIPKEIVLSDNVIIKDKQLINKILQESFDTSRTINNVYHVTQNGMNYIFSVSDNTKKELEALLKEDEDNYFKNYNYDNINYLDNDVPATKELKKLIKEALINKTLEDTATPGSTMAVYQYMDHHYDITYIPYGLNKNLDKYIMDYKNAQYIKYLENNKPESLDITFSSNYPEKINYEDYYLLDYLVKNNYSKFINYLKNNNSTFDSSSLKIMVYSPRYYKEITIASYINFKEELNKYKESLKNDSGYQNLLESIKADGETNEY